MYDAILVATDGSPAGGNAGAYGTELAHRFDAILHLVYVEESSLVRDDDTEVGRNAVTNTAEDATARDVSVTTEILDEGSGVPASVLSYATDNDIDLIVLGTHGRTGLDRFVLGNTAEQVLRDAPIPVMTVHEQTDVGRGLERIMLPTDGSESARAAVEDAIELTRHTDASLHLVHVTEERPIGSDTRTIATGDDETLGVDAVDDVIARAGNVGLDAVDVTLLGGRPDQAILAVASEHDVDCIVMGTHGRSGVRRYLLGSTTERVVRFAGVPVLAIRAPRTDVATVQYLDYTVLEERGWSLDDPDLFARAAEADLDREVHGELAVGGNEYLLDAAESEGHDWPFQCRSGGCANCVAVLREGEIEMDVNRRLTDQEVEEKGYRLTCVGSPGSDSVSIVYNAKHLDDLEDRVV